ncbi:MAG: hypothetical protein AABW68_04460, partial [archaeon]
GNRSFLVTDFYEGEKLVDGMGVFTEPFAHGKWKGVQLRAHDVIRRLEPYFSDAHTSNMIYDPVRDKLILFDLRPKQNR